MRGKKKKIEIASEEEVAKYAAGARADHADTTEPESQPTGEQTPGAGEPQADAAEVQPEQAVSEAEQWKEKFLRAKAEMANVQKRAARDSDEALRYAVAPLVRSLLPILDDLERVITHAGEHQDSAQAVLDGAKMTRDNFLKVLRDAHIEPIAADGEPFDPQVHEAVMEQPSPEHTERVVLQQIQKGYRLHDRVLRPAKVIVSKPAEPAATETGEQTAGPSLGEQLSDEQPSAES